MPEWLVERGIGETRAALVDNGEIVEARIELDGTIPAGAVIEARLISLGTHGRNGIARTAGGTEYLMARVPRELTEGETLCIEVARPAIPGPEPWKRPLAKATRHGPTRGRSLAGQLRKAGELVRELTLPAPTDELRHAGWHDLLEEARNGRPAFVGGELGLFANPAMTLIDVDGYLPPEELAVIGAGAAARAVRRLDIGGSIGIDLPTARSRVARQQAAEAVDAVLPQPFERTSVNGFGFVQIVRPRSRASLIELAQDRASFEARALLRQAVFEPVGSKRLAAHPAVIGVLEGRPDWLEKLSGQIGGALSLRADAALPMSGGYAEKL
nr:ribonuclease [Sphingomonas sp.]